ncbi:hypothetical protein [Paludisphaera borealis]|uniref:Uncharacterized protein n=1 Tax=Paludisphaera borealis TaxID=1387353 RepID=A0A1U7CYK3_9BACT|nr:hypothetical protein [Paludisphaera borealis]APW64015.1 hypothetical protein BSF38_05604 [Paludisphaera borealis]
MAPARFIAVSRLLLVGLGTIVLTAAARSADALPEVVRVPIPSKRVANFFPADTPLRLMTPREFDALVKTAEERVRRSDSGQPRLVRARHSARFSAGLLNGRSELVIANASQGSAMLPLEPWSPALLADVKSGATIGALSSGKTALWLEPPKSTDATSETTITLEWELRARPDSRGRLFALALPGDETSSLTLDAPKGWAPSGPSGRREGPVAGPGTDRELWRFHGRPAECELRLVDLEEKKDESNQPHVWVGGPTRIDLGAGGGKEARTVNFTTAWSVQTDSSETREFSAELAPELELLGVVGPNVREFHLDPRTEQGASRVTVTLAGNSQTVSTVEFQAHVRAPVEGTWTVPSIRPLPPAVWTGGATSITLDEFHTVRACRERDGRRIPPSSADPQSAAQLVFESFAPGPVADLTFRGAGTETPYVVRGRLFVRQSSTRLECEFDGLGSGGSASEYDVELPPNWILDRVQVSGVDDAVSWHQTVRPDGSILLRVLAPPADASAEGRSLTLSAGATVAPGRGPLALPRVRLVKGTIADEAWVALVDEPTLLTPISTSGLAWIDPAQVKGLLPPSMTPPSDLRPALGWRWTADAAEAMIDRQRVEQERQGWIHVKARIEDQGRRLAVSGRITVTGGREGLESLPIWIDLSPNAALSWTFSDPATGRKIATTPLSESARRKLGLPRSGVALELAATRPTSGRTAVDFRAETPWTGQGRVPLPCLPNAFAPRGVVVVEIPHRMRSKVVTKELSRIEASLAGRLAPGPGPSTTAVASPSTSSPSSPYWTAHALTYWKPGCTLDLATEELTPAMIRGVVHDARLTTLVYPQGRWLNRLRLVVGADQLDAIPLKLPADAELARVRLDGLDVAPTLDQGNLSIPPPRARNEKTRTIELDYYVNVGRSFDRRAIRPAVPDFGLPCLSFGWELVLPADWEIDRAGQGFVMNTMDEAVGWPFGSLGFPRPRWPGRRPTPVLGEEGLRALDEQLTNAASRELTFSEWFTRWDSGSFPVVIDRLSLVAEGYGPRTPCQPAQRDPSGSSVSLRTLRQNGLALVLVDDTLVVTSRREAGLADAATTWRDAVAEALFWGADRTDRFQSAARWRGEASSSDPTAARRERQLPGWSTWRLSSSGWPGQDSHVQTIDRTSRIVPGWLTAVLIVLVGLKGGRSPRRGLIVPMLLMTAAVVVHDRTRVAPAPLSAGLFLGALGLLLIRLGRLLRTTLGGARAGLRSNHGRTPFLKRTGARVATLLAATAACLAIPPALAVLDVEKPIIALIPYDGVYDRSIPPGRIVVRQEDYQRLARIAEPPPAAAGSELAILSAEHHAKRSKDREVAVVSDYTLKLGPGSVAFDFPVSGARDIEATVDDQSAPVLIAPGGERGVVTVAGSRTVRLQLRRTTVPALDGAMEVLDLKINPSPLARLILDQPPGFRPVQHLGARGKVVAKGDQTIHANLGPVDRIEISWTSAEPVLDQPSASVESIVLWDLDPAGERVRARLTYRPRRRTSTIRIAMEPGLIPREIQVPGLVDSSWGGTPQNPEWIARVDPPIQDRTTVVLDFWRPLQATTASRPGEPVDPSGAITRRFPKMEPLGVDRDSGLLAVRRPGHWTGRLEPIKGAEPLSDESFVRAWGTLPDDALTFAGTVRFNARDAVEFRTGPTPLRLKMKPSVQLRLDSGRIDCQIEAELTEISGLLDHLAFQIPEPLIVLGVESEGMTDWSRPAGRPLQVRFDHVELMSRRAIKIKIKGWIPVTELDAKAKPQQFRTPLPWIVLPGASTAPGSLIVVSKAPAELPATPGGVVLLSSGPAEAGGPGSRQVYRIDDPTKAAELRWSPPPPRVNVSVLSQMTIHPDSAEWIAILRYDVAGGSLDAIHLEIPAIWAAKAQLQLAGQDHQLTTVLRDQSTFWLITPERPIWGSQRLVLRSSVPIASEQEVKFPEVTPRGQGAADAWLGLVFATASPLTIAGSAGLQSIAYTSRFQAEEFGAAAGITTRGFHVERANWWLKVQAPRRAEASRVADDDSARVKTAEVIYVLSPDGSLLGRASYQTEPRTGQFLTVDLPAEGVPTWATVEGTAVEPLLAEGGRWMIPLEEQTTQCVTVVWNEGPAADPARSRSLGLPRAGTGRASTLVGVHLPPERVLKPALSGLEIVGSERVEQERSDQIAQRITEFLAEMDRGSGRDRERLTSLLINHELAIRTVEHALQAVSRRGADRARRDRAARELEVVKSSRAAVVEAVRSAGLDEQIESARVYLGLSDKGAGAQTLGVPEPTGVDRIRKLGKPTFLIGSMPGLQEPPVQVEVVVDGPTWYAGSSADRARSMLLLVLLLGLGVTGLTTARLAGAQSLMIAACLALAALAGGPPGLALAAAAVAVGWSSAAPWRTRVPADRVESTLGSSLVSSR